MTGLSHAAPRVAELAGSLDWATTGFGDPAGWPAGLAAVVHTVLASPVPMALVYGPQLSLVYSDGYAALIGQKHPAAFGQPAPLVLAENWDAPGHADRVLHVLATGEPFSDPDTLLLAQRGGPDSALEEVHFSRSYSPVRLDDRTVVGVLAVVIETTDLAQALSGVARLAVRMSQAASVDDVAREALRYAVSVVGCDHARVVLAEGATLRIARRSGFDSQDDSVERLPPVWSRLPPGHRLPSTDVVRTGTPLWLQGAEIRRFPGLDQEPLDTEELASVACLPLRADGVQGALSLGFDRPHAFTAAEKAALGTAASLVSQALSRARRFDEQRGLAESLQLSMLPSELPHLPGVGLAARYVPSAPGTSAGGDFYDAFALPDGSLLLAIGDVVGHGALAAAVMGQVRASLRVLALQSADPVSVLAGLDPFVASLGPEVFVTAFVGVLDPATLELRMSSAGHPPPLLRSRGAAGYLPVPAGPPLGVAGQRSPWTETLAGDDILMLYTDGLVEVPGQDISDGMATLQRLLAGRADLTDPRRLCSLVVEHLGAGGDDVAVLTMSLDSRAHRTATLNVPAESSSPGVARAWCRSHLRAWGASQDMLDTTLLGVDELVTNALLHARTGARIDLDLDDRRLLVLVTDAGQGGDLRARRADPEAARGRGLTLIEALSDAWGSEATTRGTTVWFEVSTRAGAAARLR